MDDIWVDLDGRLGVRRGSRLPNPLAGIALVSLVLFLVDTLVAVAAPLTAFDLPVARWVQQTDWGPLVPLMRLTNTVAGYRQVLVGAAAVLLVLLLDRRAGVTMAVGSLVSILNPLEKEIALRPRPTPDLVRVLDPSQGYSYPSGHAVFYTWLALMLAAALSPRLPPWLRPAVWVAAALLVVTACLGRVWAGAHWPTDVLGGFLVATAWSSFVLRASQRRGHAAP